MDKENQDTNVVNEFALLDANDKEWIAVEINGIVSLKENGEILHISEYQSADGRKFQTKKLM